MLHRAWSELFEQRKTAHRSMGRGELDLRNQNAIARAVQGHRLVINCAAYTNVDGAENEEALADEVNGTAVADLGRACGEAGAVLVHYSTDYIFNGRGGR